MVVTHNHDLPTYEELTVEEVPISTPGLRAAAHHLGNFVFSFYVLKFNFCHIVFRKVLSGCK